MKQFQSKMTKKELSQYQNGRIDQRGHLTTQLRPKVSAKRACGHIYACNQKHNSKIEGLSGIDYVYKQGHKGQAEEYTGQLCVRKGGHKHQLEKLTVQRF